MTLRRALAVVLVGALGTFACSDGDNDRPEATTPAVLGALADSVIIPSYEGLVGAFNALGDEVGALCASPGREALDTTRDAWREVAIVWRRTGAVGVGPAMDRRLEASIGFLARPESIDQLLGGSAPVDQAGLTDAGAAVQGIAALEIGLFGEGSDALATAGGARRCQYVESAATLARDANAAVLDDWTGGYRSTFVDGMDGNAHSSIDAVVNEAVSRVTEVDDRGLRALVEATGPEELSANRADGPAAFHLAELEAILDGVASVLGDGLGDPLLLDLLAARSSDAAKRLDRSMQVATKALGTLPDSVSEAFKDPGVIATAQEAVMALKVLLSTEVASELGVTIGFGDADGDS